MLHVAIMRKSWGLTAKILTGEKKIESRWYSNRYRPWNRIKGGDTVYFKDSGEPVTIKTKVDRVLQFADLTPQKVADILAQYGAADGISLDRISQYYEMFKNKKYCTLIFLKKVESVEPFGIDKTGFGSMAAWITATKLDQIIK